jgi:hypothetical protein
LSVQTADAFQVPVMRYDALFAASGFMSPDHMHPAEYVVARGLRELFAHMDKRPPPGGFAGLRDVVQRYQDLLELGLSNSSRSKAWQLFQQPADD